MKTLDELLPRFALGDMSFIQPEHIKQMANELILLRSLNDQGPYNYIPLATSKDPQSWKTPVADLPTGRENETPIAPCRFCGKLYCGCQVVGDE